MWKLFTIGAKATHETLYNKFFYAMFLKICVLIFLMFTLQSQCLAQESGGKADPPKKDQSLKSKRKLRKQDRKQWKEDRRNKRAEEKKIRNHHKRIQTKEVRRRMKRSKQTATRNHDHKREPFFQRIFTRKGKHAKKQPKEKASKVKQY